MSRFCLIICLLLGLTTAPVWAVEIPTTDHLSFSIELAPGWTLHVDEAPDALVKEMAIHVAHEPAAANATAEQIERVARKRLEANEAIIYHAATGAHLDIDFSPLEKGESAPSSRTIKNSAKYAAQSLESEEDIEAVKWDVASANIEGAEMTYLLSADYLKHEHPMTFRGYIGFVADSWFFLYFTTPGENAETLAEMEAMLGKASIRAVGQ